MRRSSCSSSRSASGSPPAAGVPSAPRGVLPRRRCGRRLGHPGVLPGRGARRHRRVRRPRASGDARLTMIFEKADWYEEEVEIPSAKLTLGTLIDAIYQKYVPQPLRQFNALATLFPDRILDEVQEKLGNQLTPSNIVRLLIQKPPEQDDVDNLAELRNSSVWYCSPALRRLREHDREYHLRRSGRLSLQRLVSPRSD